MLFNGPILLLFISFCLHHLAFYKMFRQSLLKLSEVNKVKDTEQFICELIQFHSLVKMSVPYCFINSEFLVLIASIIFSWFQDTASVYSPLILIQLICNVPFLACVVFQFDLQIQHTDFNLIIILMGLVVSSANFLVYCYFGKMATDSFAKMSKCLFESNWQNLPIQLQQYFVLMIASAQRPMYYHGANVAIINLETFTKVKENRNFLEFYSILEKMKSFFFYFSFSKRFSLTICFLRR